MSWDNTTLFADDSPEDAAFRAEVRDWVKDNCPPDLLHRPDELLGDDGDRAGHELAALETFDGDGRRRHMVGFRGLKDAPTLPGAGPQ